MKIRFLLLLLVVTLFSCEEDEVVVGSGRIFDASGDLISQSGFNLLFTINAKRSADNMYLVTPQISNLDVRIDGEHYGSYVSLPLDTASVNYFRQQDLLLSERTIDYGFLFSASNRPDTLGTVGDFTAFMNNIFDLSEGDHFLEINSFDMLDANGDTTKIRTRYFKHFEIPAGENNFYLGTITLSI